MAWNGPDTKRLDLSAFKEIRSAGFTICFPYYGERNLNMNALSLARSANIKLLLADKRIEAYLTKQDSTFNEIDNVVADYSRHPAFWGYFLADEPKASDFERLALLKEHLAAKDKQHPVYINLLPSYAAQAQRATFSYREYIDRFVQVVKPALLSFEHYPIIEYGMRDDYYDNLEIIRRTAMDHRIPFWSMALAIAYDPYPQPEHSHLRLQLYSGLAYGARGLHYFAYSVPTDKAYTYNQALLDSTGKPTPLFADAVRINAEIQKIGSVLGTLTSTGVFHTDPVPAGSAPINQRLPITKIEGRSILAGFFVDKKRHKYVMLVNKNYNFGSLPRVTFAPNVKTVVEIPKNNLAPSEISWDRDDSDKSYSVLLKAGDGRLFRIVE